MSRQSSSPRRRRNLWNANPHCIYCGRLTILIEGHVKRLPSNAATLERLYHRLDPRRYCYLLKEKEKTALSCHKCNLRKGRKDYYIFTKVIDFQI